MLTTLRTPILVMVILLTSACGEDNNSPPTTHHPASLCHDTAALDVYSDGLRKTGDLFIAELQQATPAPPNVGNNDWVFAIYDLDNQILSDLVVSVTPYMPQHSHGISPLDYTGRESEPGIYTIDTFNLIMPGVWDMTVRLSIADGQSENFTFRFCAEG